MKNINYKDWKKKVMLSRGKIIKKSCETPYIFGPKVASKREKRGKRSNLQVILDSNYGPRNLLLFDHFRRFSDKTAFMKCLCRFLKLTLQKTGKIILWLLKACIIADFSIIKFKTLKLLCFFLDILILQTCCWEVLKFIAHIIYFIWVTSQHSCKLHSVKKLMCLS